MLLLVVGGCNSPKEPAKADSKLSAREARLQAKLKLMQQPGDEPTHTGGVAAQTTSSLPPSDHDVVVKLQYSGMSAPGKDSQLNFYLQAFWLDAEYRNVCSSDTSFNLPAGGKATGKIDLGTTRLLVSPKTVTSTKGTYEIALTNAAGETVGRFSVTDSGKQVIPLDQSKKYDSKLACYYAETRMTGFDICKTGTRKAEYGIVFVGKGWNFVENSKHRDLRKGYAFPLVAVIVMPPEWMANYSVRDMTDYIKQGGRGSGGAMFYSD